MCVWHPANADMASPRPYAQTLPPACCRHDRPPGHGTGAVSGCASRVFATIIYSAGRWSDFDGARGRLRRSGRRLTRTIAQSSMVPMPATVPEVLWRPESRNTKGKRNDGTWEPTRRDAHSRHSSRWNQSGSSIAGAGSAASAGDPPSALSRRRGAHRLADNRSTCTHVAGWRRHRAPCPELGHVRTPGIPTPSRSAERGHGRRVRVTPQASTAPTRPPPPRHSLSGAAVLPHGQRSFT